MVACSVHDASDRDGCDTLTGFRRPVNSETLVYARCQACVMGAHHYHPWSHLRRLLRLHALLNAGAIGSVAFGQLLPMV